jgi:protoporphyrinogen oxidase
VEYNARVVQVDAGKHSVRLEDGRELAFDALISTMPLDSLVAVSGLAFLKAHAGRLVHNSAHILGFGLRGSIPRTADGMCWLYFPEEADPFYRVTMFSFYSPANAPEGCYSLMAEVSESPHKPVSTDDLDITCLTRLRTAGLAGADDPLVSTWTRKIERAYPVPSLGRDEALNAIIPELEKRAIYSRGRFGAWKYEVGNMDHSYAQGIEIADRLVLNSPEITTQRPEYVNEQGGGRQ